MTGKTASFQEQMSIARERMDTYEVALSVLAQGENSPYETEEFAAEIEAAKVRLENTEPWCRGTKGVSIAFRYQF